MRLACTLWIRLKKSSSGTVGARGPGSGGEHRWSSILEDWGTEGEMGEAEDGRDGVTVNCVMMV